MRKMMACHWSSSWGVTSGKTPKRKAWSFITIHYRSKENFQVKAKTLPLSKQALLYGYTTAFTARAQWSSSSRMVRLGEGHGARGRPKCRSLQSWATRTKSSWLHLLKHMNRFPSWSPALWNLWMGSRCNTARSAQTCRLYWKYM